MLEAGFQSKEKSIGDFSCYFSCLIHIAEVETKCSFDLWTVLELCVMRGYISYDFNNYSEYNNFTVLEPAKILELLTNKKWKYSKQPNTYKPKKNEYAIRRWVNKDKNHFNLPDWDSFQNSITVKEGWIESYRVLSLA